MDINRSECSPRLANRVIELNGALEVLAGVVPSGLSDCQLAEDQPRNKGLWSGAICVSAGCLRPRGVLFQPVSKAVQKLRSSTSRKGALDVVEAP